MTELSEWVAEFERKNDGTIVTQSIFIKYIENFKIIQRMLDYVLDASEEEEGEKLFLKKIQDNFKQFVIDENKKMTVADSSILKEFLCAVFEKIKAFIFRKVDVSDKAVLYCLVQTF